MLLGDIIKVGIDRLSCPSHNVLPLPGIYIRPLLTFQASCSICVHVVVELHISY